MTTDRISLEGRRMMFAKGFGDGAKMNAAVHQDSKDYLEGYEQGRKARQHAISSYCDNEGLPPANFLREQEEKIRELISGAARATEIFTEDELEDFARTEYPQTMRKP